MRFTPLFNEHGKACSADLIAVAGGGDTPTPSPMSVPGFSPFLGGDGTTTSDAHMQRQLDLLARQVHRLKAERREGGRRGKQAPVAIDAAVERDPREDGAAAVRVDDEGGDGGSNSEPDASDGELSSDSDADDDSESGNPGAAEAGSLQGSSLPPIAEGSGVGNSSSAAVADGVMMRFVNEAGNPVCIFRAILQHEGREAEGLPSVKSEILRVHDTGRWLVLLLHGGHFAGAIIHNGKVTHHKCFHRYVVRAKQGGIQSQQDNKSGTKSSKSAGASIRRHNETALRDEILVLLQGWASEIAKCNLIFLQTPVSTRGWFMTGKGAVLSAGDTRVRRVPFPTKRPTLKEILRVYAKLSAVYDDPAGPAQSSTPAQPLEPAPAPDAKHTQAHDLVTPNSDDVHEPPDYADSALYTALASGDLAAATTVLTDLPADEVNHGWNSAGESALHAAARLSGEAVTLLLERGADPTMINERGQVPFIVAVDKEARNAFRRFMAAQPERWDYDAAKVPAPLTAEMEAKQAAKAKADKKRAKDRKKKADKARAEATRKAEVEEARLAAERTELAAAKKIRDAQIKREKAMTPRQRCAAAALARLGGGAAAPASTTAKVCDYCSSPMPPNGGFEKSTYVYCQPQCMREHTPSA